MYPWSFSVDLRIVIKCISCFIFICSTSVNPLFVLFSCDNAVNPAIKKKSHSIL